MNWFIAIMMSRLMMMVEGECKEGNLIRKGAVVATVMTKNDERAAVFLKA